MDAGVIQNLARVISGWDWMKFCESFAALLKSKWLNRKLSIRCCLESNNSCTFFPNGTKTIKLTVGHQCFLPLIPATVRKIKIKRALGWSIADWIFTKGLQRMAFGDSLTAIDITLRGRIDFAFPAHLRRLKLRLERQFCEAAPWKLPDFPTTLIYINLFTQFDHGNICYPDSLKYLKYHASITDLSTWRLPKHLQKLCLTGYVTDIQHLIIPKAVWNLALGLCARDIPDNFRFPENVKVLHLGLAKSSWELPKYLEKLILDYVRIDSKKYAFPDTLKELVIAQELKNPIEWELPKRCSIKYKRL